MKKKILLLSIIFVIIVSMFSFTKNVNAETDIKIIGNSVFRTDGTTATINLISNTTGTIYYKITNSNVAPTAIDITNGTEYGSITLNTTQSISLAGLTNGAKYVHIVVKNGDNLSNVLTVEMPYDVYYFDNFEAYSENTYPGFFNLRYNGSNASLQKIITLNENKVFNAYGTFVRGLDERIQINPLSTGYAVLETDISASSIASNDWYFGGIVIGPNYDNNNRSICIQIDYNSKKFGLGENANNHTSNILFEVNKNYHVKMVLDVENHKLDYYINNVKANEEPISIPNSYYTSLNWFGIYGGSGTVYYDNMKFYVTSSRPIEKYTVTFNTNGGNTVENQTIKSGETAMLPTAPTKTNYTFGGWYADEELTTPFDFTTTITVPTTIYAKWTEKFSEKTITKTESKTDMTVSVEGNFSGNPVLVITKTEKENEGYNSLISLVKEDKEVIGSYDVSIVGGTYKGKLELTFTVGKQYEGDTITIYHEKASGDVETLTAVVIDGKVVITVSELSPFMLVANKKVVERAKEKLSVNKETIAKKDESPKTGELNTNILIAIASMIVILSVLGIVIARLKYRKSNI